jgi:hypothetical protein
LLLCIYAAAALPDLFCASGKEVMLFLIVIFHSHIA